jgi:hypothetical protein
MRRCHSPSAQTRDAFHRIGDYLHRRPDIDAEESKDAAGAAAANYQLTRALSRFRRVR